MRHITIKSTLRNTQNNILFEGSFPTLKDGLEAAISDNVALDNADLSNQNLTNANLDEYSFKSVTFEGSNLSGTNLSACNLSGSNLKNTSLYNTCFAESNLQYSDFTGAFFGGTDIAAANIMGCVFSTMTSFDLDFILTRNMDDVTFLNPDGKHCNITNPPIVVKNILPKPLIIMDRTVKYGHDILPTPLLQSGKLAKLIQELRHSQKTMNTTHDAIASAQQL